MLTHFLPAFVRFASEYLYENIKHEWNCGKLPKLGLRERGLRIEMRRKFKLKVSNVKIFTLYSLFYFSAKPQPVY